MNFEQLQKSPMNIREGSPNEHFEVKNFKVCYLKLILNNFEV